MTKNKDAEILAEAYKNITTPQIPVDITENMDIDPNNIQSAIAHLLSLLGPILLYKAYKFIKSLKEEQDANKFPKVKLNDQGAPEDPNEPHTQLPSSLIKARNTLNKGKTRV